MVHHPVRLDVSAVRNLAAGVLAAVLLATIGGCMGSGAQAPVPDNVKPVYGKGSPPPPVKGGKGPAAVTAPPMGGTSANPNGIPEKK